MFTIAIYHLNEEENPEEWKEIKRFLKDLKLYDYVIIPTNKTNGYKLLEVEVYK